MLEELRAALSAIEEQRRVERERIEAQERLAALIEEARSALQDNRFDAALTVLSTAGQIDPAAPELLQLTEQVHRAQTAARLSAELDAVLEDLAERLAGDELTGANDLLEKATALAPADSRVLAARQRIEQASAARDAAAARARELAAQQTAAQESFDRGDLQGALRQLKIAQQLDADDARTLLLSRQIEDALAKQEAAEAAEHRRRTVDDLLAAATQHLESGAQGAAAAASQKITEALALAPDHGDALALKVRADGLLAAERHEAVVQATIRNARSRFAHGKHQAAFRILEELGPAAHPIIADTLKELRETFQQIEDRRRAEQELADKRSRAAALVLTARLALEGGRFTEALDVLSVARLLDPASAGLAELTKRALREQAAAAAAHPAKEEIEPDDDATRVILMPGGDASRRPADQDATRVILMPGANASRAPADDATRVILTPPAHASAERAGDSEEAPAGTTPDDANTGVEDRLAPAWRWALIAAAAIVVLIALFALLRHGRPALNTAHPFPGLSRDNVRQLAESSSGSGMARA